MKKFLITLCAAVTLVSCSSEPEGFKAGDEISEENAMTAADMKAAMKGKDSMEVKLTAKVNAVCQVKGCWMRLDMENGEEMMVKFKDYAFFVPKDATGKTATVEGWAKIHTTSVAELKHYAEDDGKSQEEIDAITEPKTEMVFEAKGVVLK